MTWLAFTVGSQVKTNLALKTDSGVIFGAFETATITEDQLDDSVHIEKSFSFLLVLRVESGATVGRRATVTEEWAGQTQGVAAEEAIDAGSAGKKGSCNVDLA